MSGSWGRNFRVTIFGESHGRAIGVILDGVRPGLRLDMDHVERQMERRAPGRDKLSTSRREKDQVQLLSGVVDGVTTGTPISCMIENRDTRSDDYRSQDRVFRPSHADHTGWVKYRGFNDHRGGGHFSGRITAGLVFAGAVASQILREKGVTIGSHITRLGDMKEESFLDCQLDQELLKRLGEMELSVVNEENSEIAQDQILLAKSQGDSVGGAVEVGVLGLDPGLGDPFFDSVESVLAGLLFSIPAIKGVEFGRGFKMAASKGSQVNDEPCMDGSKIGYISNNNGGVLGGITNGMPLVFSVAIKPTPSIGKAQRTVDVATGEAVGIEVSGRHDPCIVKRAVPVVEAAAAIALVDMAMEAKKWD